MLYVKCPTCKSDLGDKQLLYEEKMKEICNSENSDEDKEKMLNELKIKILEELKIERLCCKMRIICYNDLINIVK